MIPPYITVFIALYAVLVTWAVFCLLVPDRFKPEVNWRLKWAKFCKRWDADVQYKELRPTEFKYYTGDFHTPDKVLYCSLVKCSNCKCYKKKK